MASGQSISDGLGGFANLTGIPGTSDPCILELNNFNVGSVASPVQSLVVDTDVPNLTIKLIGESKLTGSSGGVYSSTPKYGLIYSTGNLTITTDTEGILRVNNTQSGSGDDIYSIYAKYNIFIESGANVTAIAADTGSRGSIAILSEQGSITIKDYPTIVKAYSMSTSEDAYAIKAANNYGARGQGFINIIGAKLVEANATSTNYNAYPLYAFGDIKIESVEMVTTNATSTCSSCYSFYTMLGGIKIVDSTVMANATVQNPSGSSTSSVALWANGGGSSSGFPEYSDDIVISNSTVIVTADGSAPNSSPRDRALSSNSGNITIDDASTVYASAINGKGGSTEAMYAEENILIDSAKKVTAIANGTNRAYGLYSNTGYVSITGANTVIDANAISTNFGVVSSIYSNTGLNISSVKMVKATATSTAPSGNNGKAYALYVNAGNFSIKDTQRLDAEATSAYENAYTIYANNDVIIESSDVNATAETLGSSMYAYGLYATNGGISITDSSDVTANATAPSGYAWSISSSQPGCDITITNAGVNAKALASNEAKVLYSAGGNVSITDADVDLNATSINNEAHAIFSSNDIKVDSSAKVTANALGSTYAYGLYSGAGDVSIGQNAIVEANATGTLGTYSMSSETCSIYANKNIKINSANKVYASAESASVARVYGMYAATESFEINASIVSAIANSTNGDNAEALRAYYNLTISNNSEVTAIAGSTDDAKVFTINSKYGDIEINSSIVNSIANSTNGSFAEAFEADNNFIISDNSVVTAIAESTGTAEVFAIDAYNNLEIKDSTVKVAGSSNSSDACGCYSVGDLTITGAATIVEANAISIGSDAYSIDSSGDLTIDGINSLTAIGTSSSFVYVGSCDVTGLADYTFSNASVLGDEPTSYTAFTDNWYYDSGMSAYCSNYTAVKIVKGSGTTDASIKVTISGSNAGTDPVNLTLTPVSTGTSGTYNIGTNKAYLIKPVTPGVYSLDATYTNNSMEHKLTKQVTVTTANRTDVTFNLLTTNVTTDVKTSKGTATDTPKVAVDGLDEVASAIQPAAGQMVNISLSVEGNSDTSTADQQMLKNNRTYSAGTPSFINFTVTNTTSYINGTVISNSTMDNLSTVLTIYVAYDMTRENIEVFRIHNGTVENFTETSTRLTTPVDRYFFKGESGIYIYTQKFSSYMISSTSRSSPVTPSSGSSSSSHHSGSSQLAKSQDVYVTPEPTAVPTQGSTTVITSSPTASSTTQPTQSSPAPIAGLIAGLGAVALVLARMRR